MVRLALVLCAFAFVTQFRGNDRNNAVVPGRLAVSWQVRTGERISASPTYAAGLIFIGTNGGTLYAIRASDGGVLWKRRFPNPLMSAPLVYRGMVIVGEGNAGTPRPKGGGMPHVGTGPSAMIALDARTGALRWQHSLPGSGMPTPAIVDGVLVHHDGSGRITGMDPMTGRLLYERDLHSVASMTAALPAGRDAFVTVGALYNAVWKIAARNGRVIWRKDPFPRFASGMGDCPIAGDGTLLFGDYVVGDPPQVRAGLGDPVREHLYAMRVSDGALVWDVPLETGPLPPRNEAGVPAVARGIVYVGGAAAPWVNAVEARTGRLLWRARTRGVVRGGFVVRDGVAYFGDFEGYLWALDARTGSVVGDLNAGTPFNVGSPIAVGKTLVIGSLYGTVFAVPLQAIRSRHDP
jgi:outer membrane protein assembly factor BamB